MIVVLCGYVDDWQAISGAGGCESDTCQRCEPYWQAIGVGQPGLPVMIRARDLACQTMKEKETGRDRIFSRCT